jgi:hypothetical protein
VAGGLADGAVTPETNKHPITRRSLAALEGDGAFGGQSHERNTVMVAHRDRFVQRITQILVTAGINPARCRIAGLFAVSGVLKDLVCGDVFDPGRWLVVVEHRPSGDQTSEDLPQDPLAAYPAHPTYPICSGIVFIGFPKGIEGTPELLILGREAL